METIIYCPLCGSTKFEKILSIKDHSISKETFHLTQCLKCNLVFTNPRPDKYSISAYYESPEYISHSNSSKGILNKLYQIVRKLSAKNKLAILTDLGYNEKKVLDIGCGTGEFLNHCKLNGWETKGIEPNEKARNFAIKQYGLNVTNENTLVSIESNSFNIITLWHVLEHVIDLNKRIEEISRLLKQDGVAIIAVPNNKSYDAVHYQDYWAAYDVPRHLYHFNEITIKELFKSNGFHWKKSLPMKFDAYYVSVLSEKYKKSNFQFIRALYQGFLSNYLAKGNPEKYSSVIYLFKK